MTKFKLSKLLVEAALNKTLRDLQTNPEQTLRHWSEKAAAQAQNHGQRDLMTQLAPLLTQPDGAYLVLARRLLAEVDPERLKTLALNLCYSVATEGAQIARAQELRHGVHIPWTVFFELDGVVTPEQLYAIIEQGKALGIYSYQLFCRTEQALSALPTLFRAQADCVFFVYLRPEAVSRALVDDWKTQRHVLPFVLTRGGRADEALSLLRAAGFLCGTCLEYDAAVQTAITSGTYLAEAARGGAALAALWPQKGTDAATRATVSRTLAQQRLAQMQPVIPLDLLNDSLETDRQFSKEAALLYFNGAGQRIDIEQAYREREENLMQSSFLQILEALSSQ